MLSVLFGISTFLFLPDTPLLSSRWLSEHEQRYLTLLHRATRGSNAARNTNSEGEVEQKKKHVDWKAIKQIFGDKHIYLQAIIFASNAIPSKLHLSQT